MFAKIHPKRPEENWIFGKTPFQTAPPRCRWTFDLIMLKLSWRLCLSWSNELNLNFSILSSHWSFCYTVFLSPMSRFVSFPSLHHWPRNGALGNFEYPKYSTLLRIPHLLYYRHVMSVRKHLLFLSLYFFTKDFSFHWLPFMCMQTRQKIMQKYIHFVECWPANSY